MSGWLLAGISKPEPNDSAGVWNVVFEFVDRGREKTAAGDACGGGTAGTVVGTVAGTAAAMRSTGRGVGWGVE
jgi:hypothetical protein